MMTDHLGLYKIC
uniref:Protein polybromo1like [Metaseiulus occidentalis] n=2 Tax=Lepeophtheirus salmonis TaxID=72036 RepID=A0A0K2VDI1_LEPSM